MFSETFARLRSLSLLYMKLSFIKECGKGEGLKNSLSIIRVEFPLGICEESSIKVLMDGICDRVTS